MSTKSMEQHHFLIIVIVRYGISMKIWMKLYAFKIDHYDAIRTFQNYEAGASNSDFTLTYISITMSY